MAKKNTGYIKISRDILHSSLWASERFTLGQIWIDLNLRANHSDQTKIQQNHSYILRRGQVTASLTQFGEWWNMNRQTAQRKLLLLQELGLLWYDSETLSQTLVTLVNYGVEQDGNGLGCDAVCTTISTDVETDNGQAFGQDLVPPSGHTIRMNKNDNKNDKRMREE